MAINAVLLDADAFARLVVENNLRSYEIGGAIYAGMKGKDGWEIYRLRCDSVAWDAYPIDTITVTSPAAGAEWTYTLPTGYRYLLMAAEALFTTAVAAANRNPGLVAQLAGTNRTLYTQTAVNQTASLAVEWGYTYGAVPGTTYPATIGALKNVLFWNLAPVELKAGSVISSLTTNIQAADAYTAVKLYVKRMPVIT